MGRYENALKYVQLRSMIEEKKYEEALEIAEQLEMGRIKDVSELKLIADVYRKCGIYDRAKELYYVIYNEHSIRRNLYTLIMICLKDKSYDEAEDLYKEYITKDKGSIYRYILRYRIDKSKNADIGVIISDLEKIKEEFYMEDWGYELARQYHKAGRIEDCLAECDDLILWFGEGEVVEKARLLKMHYDENVDGDILQNLQTSIGNDISRYMEKTEDIEKTGLIEKTELIVTEEAGESYDDNVYNDNVYNEIDNEQLKNNAISEASEFKNVMIEAAKASEEEVEVMSLEEDIIEVAEAEESREAEDISEAEESREAEDISETEESQETEDLEEDAAPAYELSRYGSRFNYINTEELYDRMDIGVHAPVNYAIALTNDDDAMGVVREIAKKIKAQGYLKNPKIARISAEKLNNIRLYDQMNALLGTCMLIENASLMSSKTVNVIIKLMDAHASDIVLILVDEEEKLSKFLLKEAILCNQIDNFVLK